MTNPKRGAFTFTAAGKTFTLKLGTNAMVHYQHLMKETVVQAVQSIEEAPGDMMRLRALLFVGIVDKGDLTEDDIGDIIDEIGLPKLSELISEALRAAFPDPEAGDPANAGKGEGNGKKAAKTQPTTA